MAQPEIGEGPDFPHASPATDPTNPWHQEARGIWEAAERASSETGDREKGNPKAGRQSSRRPSGPR